jgi:hypothetical protein
MQKSNNNKKQNKRTVKYFSLEWIVLQYFFPCVYLYLKSVGVTESGKEETKLIC